MDETHLPAGDILQTDEPVLFDVGVVALAHSGMPMSGTALEYVRAAVSGDLDAVIPYTVLFGAHHVLRAYYDFSQNEATYVLTNLLDARHIHWYTGPTKAECRDGLALAGEHNIDGWDGYYAHVAQDAGASTVIGIDDDFERVEGLTVEIPLTDAERTHLHDYLAQ